MAYKLIRTDKFDEELFDIICYIASSSGDKNIALNYLDEIEEHAKILETFPEAGSQPRSSILRKQGYRAFVLAKNHIAFYKINKEKKEVVLYHIVDARRNYIKLIRD